MKGYKKEIIEKLENERKGDAIALVLSKLNLDVAEDIYKNQTNDQSLRKTILALKTEIKYSRVRIKMNDQLKDSINKEQIDLLNEEL